LDSDLSGEYRPCCSKEEDEPAALRQLPKTGVINRSHLYKKKFRFPLEANSNELRYTARLELTEKDINIP